MSPVVSSPASPAASIPSFNSAVSVSKSLTKEATMSLAVSLPSASLIEESSNDSFIVATGFPSNAKRRSARSSIIVAVSVYSSSNFS